MKKTRAKWKNVFLVILFILLIMECAGMIYLVKNNSSLQEKVSAAQYSLQQNEQLLEEKNDEKSSQEVTLEQLQLELSQKESEIASLQQTLSDSSAQLNTSNQQLTVEQSKVNELQQQINDKTNKIEQLNQEIEQLKISKQQKAEAIATASADVAFTAPAVDVAAAPVSNKKVAYLTFDDGPSNITPQVLDILDQYNAKATFFVVYEDKPDIVPYYKEIVNRGHQIAIHTATHQYTQIYASVDAYVADFNKIKDFVAQQTGVNCNLFRFPGGSKNNYNKAISDSLINHMQSNGYIYFDWNISIDDAVKGTTVDQMVDNALNNIEKRSVPVILCHDGSGHADTVTALPRILQGAIDKGYTFEKLTSDVTPVQFGKNW